MTMTFTQGTTFRGIRQLVVTYCPHRTEEGLRDGTRVGLPHTFFIYFVFTISASLLSLSFPPMR
jgi:hypothetical protein